MAKEQLGVKVDPETRKEIEDKLEYGDTISEWVREAIKQRLEREKEEKQEAQK